MDVKALAHGLTPPLIWNAARRILRGAHAQPLVEEPFKPFEGDYASFDDALAAAGNTDADNYQKEPEISYVVSSTAAIRNSREMNLAAAFRVLALIEYIQLRSSARRVVDFGGALGHYYFRLRPHLSGPLSWQVVELPAMIEAAADFG